MEIRRGSGMFGQKEIRNAYFDKLTADQIRELRDLRDDALTVINPSQVNEAARVRANLQKARRVFNWQNTR